MAKSTKSHIVLKTSTVVWVALILAAVAAVVAIGAAQYNYDLNNRLYNIEFDSRLVDLTHKEENRRFAFCLKHDIKDCTPEAIGDWNNLHKDDQLPLKTQEQISRELAESLSHRRKR